MMLILWSSILLVFQNCRYLIVISIDHLVLSFYLSKL